MVCSRGTFIGSRVSVGQVVTRHVTREGTIPGMTYIDAKGNASYCDFGSYSTNSLF